ncbi:MAG: hypothetical protein JWP10_1082 [Nocardioidaceae bacterium]|nr:hypothetical protein [Nocardioidaceae bacterium]
MANKTVPTPEDVSEFLSSLGDERKRADSLRLVELMRLASGHEPVMWGPTMVGFGAFHYRYESGREGDTFEVGFSPRASAISLYAAGANAERADVLARLGKHRVGTSCIYIKRLADVDERVLVELIEESVSLARSLHVDR